MNYLIYHAYGPEDFKLETLYSLLSYYSFHSIDANQVVIYTDDEVFFQKWLPQNVIYSEVTAVMVADWTREVPYHHRIKVKILQDACKKLTGNFLYVDTDTYFIANTEPLFNLIEKGEFFFHVNEGPLTQNHGGIARKIRRFLKKRNTFKIAAEAEPIVIDGELEIWNAGVLGFNPDFYRHLAAIEQISDIFYLESKIFTSEQVAWNCIVQRYFEPMAADQCVRHYWDFKEFRGVLRHFFSHYSGKTFEELKDGIAHVNPELLSQDKRDYKAMGFWAKQWRRLTRGHKWKIPDYELN